MAGSRAADGFRRRRTDASLRRRPGEWYNVMPTVGGPAMSDSRLIHSLRLRNLLSFGPDAEQFELGPLNVLIGPNGSGKSNLIEALRLLHAATGDLVRAALDGGGFGELVWKGSAGEPEVDVVVDLPTPEPGLLLRHQFRLAGPMVRPALRSEELMRLWDGHDPVQVYHSLDGVATVMIRDSGPRQHAVLGSDDREPYTPTELRAGQSILSQWGPVGLSPEIDLLFKRYSGIYVFDDWSLGRGSPVRRPVDAAADNTFLARDGSNLAMVVNALDQSSAVHRQLLDDLQRFSPRIVDFRTKTEGGTIQLFFEEEALRESVPAARASHGTLRFFCLLTILRHPHPPPLIGLEEPEIGLHPDILPWLGELLVEASERTQLVVTTHSDALLTRLDPAHVLVTERDEAGTRLRRLERDALSEWLAEYTLGDLWRMGELGGNRW
ncbi:MAG: AAA family ATPase [Armatimonadetes bacterium]|nr:AAA family ATPase [Armatimonadota bacterium]